MNTFGFDLPNDFSSIIGSIGRSSIYGGGKKATIIFVEPVRRVLPQVRRPHVYTLDMNFQDAVCQVLKQPKNITNASMLIQSPSAYGSVLPTVSGIGIDTRAFADQWSFILHVDNDNRVNGQAIGFNSGPKNRLVYTGYCSGEPVNPVNMGQGLTINPACVLQILHHTQVSVVGEGDPINGVRYRDHTTSDFDFAPATAVMATSAKVDLYLNTPWDTRNNTIVTKMPGETVYHDSESVVPELTFNTGNNFEHMASTEQSAAALNCSIKNPRAHLQNLVVNLVDSVEHAEEVSASRFGEGRMTNYAGPNIVGDRFHDLMMNYAVQSRIVIGIDPSRPISIGELLQTYPNLQVVSYPISIGDRDIVDPYAPTPDNMLAELVCNFVLSNMTDIGLMSIGFIHDSTYQNLRGLPGLTEIKSAEAINAQASDHDFQRKIGIFIRNVEEVLFPMIRVVGKSEFRVSVMCSSCGESIVQLNLLDHDNCTGGLFVTNNALGGIGSPLIGDTDICRHNAYALNGVLGTFSNHHNTIPRINNFDDLDRRMMESMSATLEDASTPSINFGTSYQPPMTSPTIVGI